MTFSSNSPITPQNPFWWSERATLLAKKGQSAIGVAVHGAKEVAAKFRNMALALPGEVDRTSDEVLEYLLMAMPGYPPPIIGSTYERTGRLGRALTSRADEDPMSLSRVETVGQGVNLITLGVGGYGPYVVHQPTQVRVHRGRWFTLERFVSVSAGTIRKMFTNAAVVARRRAGL